MINSTQALQLQGPTGDPVEEVQRFATDPFNYIEDCVQRYGEVFQLPFSTEGEIINTVVFSHPEAVRIFYASSTLKYLENQRTPALDALLGGHNHLTALDKVPQQRMKKLMMPYFHGQALQSQAQQIWQIAQQVSSTWATGEPFWAFRAMGQLSLEVIVQIVLGITQGPRYEPLKAAIVEWLDWSGSPEISQALYLEHLRQDQGLDSPWGKHLNNLKQIDQILYGEIGDRRANPETSGIDILSMLLVAEDEAGNRLTDTEIRDNLMLTFLAGYEATATSLTWCLYALSQNPTVAECLQQALATLDNTQNPLEVCALPYLGAICKEVLRIYTGSVLSASRILNAPFEFMGYALVPGTALSASYYLLHRREDLYPQPNQFRPERFLEQDYGPHEWAGFGGGHRRCLGYALAEMEIKLALAVFFLNYHLKRTDNQPIQMVRKNQFIVPEPDFQITAISK